MKKTYKILMQTFMYKQTLCQKGLTLPSAMNKVINVVIDGNIPPMTYYIKIINEKTNRVYCTFKLKEPHCLWFELWFINTKN